MTFIEYYIEQFKKLPFIWKEAKKANRRWAFLITSLLLLFPIAIYMMYLYDMGKMKVDSRYAKKAGISENQSVIKPEELPYMKKTAYISWQLDEGSDTAYLSSDGETLILLTGVRAIFDIVINDCAKRNHIPVSIIRETMLKLLEDEQ